MDRTDVTGHREYREVILWTTHRHSQGIARLQESKVQVSLVDSICLTMEYLDDLHDTKHLMHNLKATAVELFADKPAPLAYSVHYAAPEVIQADALGQQTMLVSGALDMWSLGVVAVELLTGGRIFAPPLTEDDARAQLLGTKPLPWEDPVLQEDLLPKLKVLKRSVLQCLERDPAKRPTSRELLGAGHGLFESVTGTTTSEYIVPVPNGQAQRHPGEVRGTA
jgi:hypothetical protein